MTRIARKIIIAGGTALLLMLAVAACGGAGPPTGIAAGLLSKAGATASGPAYTVGYGDSNATCNTGAAEADGTTGMWTVKVCIFAGDGQLVSYVNAVDYASTAAMIRVGQASLILVTATAYGSYATPPASLMQSIASKTGGSVYK